MIDLELRLAGSSFSDLRDRRGASYTDKYIDWDRNIYWFRNRDRSKDKNEVEKES